MLPKSPLGAKSPKTEESQNKVLDLIEKDPDTMAIRIGSYFNELTKSQRARFKTIVSALSKRFSATARANPLETLLIRQIALNTVRIESAEQDIAKGKVDAYSSDVSKWLFAAQKERREAMDTLLIIIKRDERKKAVTDFGDMRQILRKEENLPDSPIPINPDGYDRRTYDDITRTQT